MAAALGTLKKTRAMTDEQQAVVAMATARRNAALWLAG
jgi:hypothetical protein